MNENLKKAASVAAATVIGATAAGTSALASEQPQIANVDSTINYEVNNIDNAIDSLYQSQMSYLVETQSKLRNFFETIDTKGIIKNAFPIAYSVAYAPLNAQAVSYGHGYNYMCNNENVLEEIMLNNKMLGALRIKPAGNARDTDYGIISDPTDEKGFRVQTEEDKQLINEFMDLVGDRYIVNQSLINVLSSAKNNEVNEEEFNTALDEIYQSQMSYLIPAQERIRTFFETVDNKDIIKTGYSGAYNAAYADLECEVRNYGIGAYRYVSNNPDLLAAIKNNNILISSLNIKRSGSARDTDFGVIIDPNAPAGIRTKTEEDLKLIDEYTQNIGNQYSLNYPVINCLESIRELQNNNTMGR